MHYYELESFYKKHFNIIFDNEFRKIKEAGENLLAEKLADLVHFIAQKHPKFETQSDQVYKSIGGEFATAYRFWQSGKNIFQLTEGITQLLSNTEVGAITLDMVNLPFETIYLAFPGTMCPKGMDGENLLGLYIQLSNKTDKPEAEKYLTLKFMHAYKHLKEQGQIDQQFTALLGGEVTFGFNKKSNVFDQIVEQMQQSDMPIEKDHFLKIIEIVLNTMMYLSTEKPDTQYIKKQKTQESANKNKKKNKFKLDVDHFIIGSKIKIDNKIPKIVYVGDIQSHEALDKSKSWFVRGHWRQQPYGPGMSLRKTIWIEPYIKGDGELIKKAYTIH